MKATTLSIIGVFAAMAMAITSQAQTILIDLGNSANVTTSPGTWNNTPPWDPINTGAVIANLKDNTGGNTGISLSVTDAFNGINAVGSSTSTAFPTTATIDSWFSQGPGSQGVLSFAGLDPSLTYTFTLYASRSGLPAGDNRESRFTLTGLNSGFADLAVSNNVDTTVTISNISPTLGGVITLTLAAGPNNNQNLSYLGVIQMTAVPEPGVAGLALAGSLGVSLLRRRLR